MPQDLTDDKWTLVQVMAWCRQATSHYLNQCWPRSPMTYGITRPQWVKDADWWSLLLLITNKCQTPLFIFEIHFSVKDFNIHPRLLHKYFLKWSGNINYIMSIFVYVIHAIFLYTWPWYKDVIWSLSLSQILFNRWYVGVVIFKNNKSGFMPYI